VKNGYCQKHSRWLIGAGVLAFLWVIARAHAQSITIDEADGYLLFAARADPSHWVASSMNHLLNSLLMRLFIGVFWLSPVMVRMPSLIGAGFYIAAVYVLVRLVSGELRVQLPLFVCMVYNPFVMDHLVAARGYSLGVGLLMAAVAIAARELAPEPVAEEHSYRACMLCSICAGLSFCATYSFAVVDAAAMGFIFAAFAGRASRKGLRRGFGSGETVRLLAACAVPGLLVTALLAGDILVHWRQISLAWGAKSLTETAASVIKSSYYEPNDFLLSPPVYWFVTRCHKVLFPLLGVACLVQLGWVVARRRMEPDRMRWVGRLGLGAAGILAIALGVHRVMYGVGDVLMPLGRRAIFIAPLLTLAIGALIAIDTGGGAGRWIRRWALGMLCITAAYFVTCLRLNYFMEWKYNADAREVYSVLSYYNHRWGVKEVSTNWRYCAALNFYRVLSSRETLEEIPGGPAEVAVYPLGKPVYVLYYNSDVPFIEAQHLKVVYHNLATGAAVAIRPEIEGAVPRG
jgi:hypothetical protein